MPPKPQIEYEVSKVYADAGWSRLTYNWVYVIIACITIIMAVIGGVIGFPERSAHPRIGSIMFGFGIGIPIIILLVIIGYPNPCLQEKVKTLPAST